MPRFRIHRIRETQKDHFRWLPHTGGLAIVKPKDYELAGEVEGPSPYTIWKSLKVSTTPEDERPLVPGDVLEALDGHQAGTLLIVKYIGFEPAHWFVPEVKNNAVPPEESSSSANLLSEQVSEPERTV